MHIKEGIKLSLEAMRKNIPKSAKERFYIGLERGQLQIELYIPKKEDLQKPHERDECYVITKGSGQFVMGGKTVEFKQGDFLFVPARMPHKFINFGSEMETWVIFYGPEGGENIE